MYETLQKHIAYQHHGTDILCINSAGDTFKYHACVDRANMYSLSLLWRQEIYSGKVTVTMDLP